MNFMLNVAGFGHLSVEVSKGTGLSASSWVLVVRRVHDGNRGGFHVKFAFKVSSPSFLLASILNRAGWSVSSAWIVRARVMVSLEI